jgi:hypothetical protein
MNTLTSRMGTGGNNVSMVLLHQTNSAPLNTSRVRKIAGFS